MKRRQMLVRMVAASLTRRKSRVAIAFAALVIGTAIASGLGSVYYDLGWKMSRELRAYGANLVVAPARSSPQQYIGLDELSTIATKLDSARLVGYVPYLYGIARLGSQQVVLVGTRFDQAEKVNPYWKVAGQMPGRGAAGSSALVGEVVASRLGLSPGDTVRMTAGDGLRDTEVRVSGVLSTGGEEDSQVFLPFDMAAGVLDKQGVVSVAYFSIIGNLSEVDSFARSIEAEFPWIDAAPIKQVSQSEGQVLDRIRSLVLLAVAVIVLLTLLCVVISMMNMALERRQEIGLKKAMGARERDILLEFVAEGIALGLVAGLLGWALGFILAQGIGQSVFQSSISLRVEILPMAIFLSMGLAGGAALLPARSAAKVQPATTLRGE